ncbi:MAG: HD domain-containing phosphohydrolase [bacterium]
MKKRILLVDDEQSVLDALRRMLRPQREVWDVWCVSCPNAAWKLMLHHSFDAMVLDIKMPYMSGLELLQCVQQAEQTWDLPVVMLTDLCTREIKRQALDLGAADLLNKPVAPEDLIARLRSVLRLKSYQDELKSHKQLLEQRVAERTSDLVHARLDIIWRLGKAAEHRDTETGNHVIRVGCMSREIAECLHMDRDFVETLFLAAPLHDIGKIGIPDAILLNPSRLNSEEWNIMKQHCQIGARILREECTAKFAFREWRGTQSQFDDQEPANPVLDLGASIALTHHEKWDGSGYPRGLSGDEIPFESRIVAICDVFDAMTSHRPYKNAFTEDQALSILREGRGRHFAPEIHAAFMKSYPAIRSIRERFRDNTNVRVEAEDRENDSHLVCG